MPPKKVITEPKPKGRAAAKKAAAAKAEDGTDGKLTEAQEKHALQKRFLGAMSYKCKNMTEGEMAEQQKQVELYKAQSPQLKAEALAEFARTKNIKFVGQWAKRITESSAKNTTQHEGWMSKQQIMHLANVLPSCPEYETLWTALEITLLWRPHSLQTWADIGVREYYFVHSECLKTVVSTVDSTELAGKGTGKGSSMDMLTLTGDPYVFANVTCMS